MQHAIYQPASAVLCFQDYKQAALYFDRVLPLDISRWRGDPEYGDMMIGIVEEIPSEALHHLVVGIEGSSRTWSHSSHAEWLFDVTMKNWMNFWNCVKPYFGPIDESLRSYSPDPEIFRQRYDKLIHAYMRNAAIDGAIPLRNAFHEYALGLGFSSYSVALPAIATSIQPQSDPCLTLHNLNLVDVRKADWPQILELRKDVDSHRKLARLRLFIHENYSGRSLAYIEDDLSRRIDDYERVTKKFGLSTTLSSLSILLDAKALHVAAGAGIVAALFGGPIAGISAASAIELGKIAVNVAEKHHEMKDWRDGHELAFIFETNERLS